MNTEERNRFACCQHGLENIPLEFLSTSPSFDRNNSRTAGTSLICWTRHPIPHQPIQNRTLMNGIPSLLILLRSNACRQEIDGALLIILLARIWQILRESLLQSTHKKMRARKRYIQQAGSCSCVAELLSSEKEPVMLRTSAQSPPITVIFTRQRHKRATKELFIDRFTSWCTFIKRLICANKGRGRNRCNKSKGIQFQHHCRKRRCGS